MKHATVLSSLALALVSCVLDNPGSPDARAYPERDGGHVPGFRDAGCPGGAPSGSGTRSGSGISGLGCDVDASAPPIDAAPACGEHTFRYADAQAVSVWVTGSFTGWAETPPGARVLSNDGLGVWTLTTYLGPGHHTYKLIVDGEWILDPSNELIEDDGEGNRNSVLELCDVP